MRNPFKQNPFPNLEKQVKKYRKEQEKKIGHTPLIFVKFRTVIPNEEK